MSPHHCQQMDFLADVYANDLGIPDERRAEAFRYAVADGLRDSAPEGFRPIDIMTRLAGWQERDITSHATS